MTLTVKLEASEKPATIKLSLKGELDALTSRILEQSINGALDLHAKTLILDFGELSFIASAGLKVLAKTKKSMKQRDGHLLFVNVQPQVQKVFDIVKAVRVSDIFASYEELDNYLKAMQGKTDSV